MATKIIFLKFCQLWRVRLWISSLYKNWNWFHSLLPTRISKQN